MANPTIHSSIRIYNENGKKPMAEGEKDFIKVPASLRRPKELPPPPRSYIEKEFNIHIGQKCLLAGTLPQWSSQNY